MSDVKKRAESWRWYALMSSFMLSTVTVGEFARMSDWPSGVWAGVWTGTFLYLAGVAYSERRARIAKEAKQAAEQLKDHFRNSDRFSPGGVPPNRGGNVD